MDVFSNSFAKRPGQYGSTVTLAALMSVAMLSACSQHNQPVSGRGRSSGMHVSTPVCKAGSAP